MSNSDDPSARRITARNGFLAACSLAGAATTAYRSPRDAADEDDPCWIDIARLGSPDAPNVLILCCGLNGIEGHCGSTILTDWLSQGLQRQVPRDVGLIMIHTILPATLTIGGAAAPERTPIRSWSDNVLSAAARRFASYAERTGLKTLDAPAIDDVPETETAWMTEASNAVADKAVEHASRVSILEFHTGLRPEGEVAISSCHPAGTEGDQRVKSWFGEDSGARSDSPAILDIFALGLGERLADLTLTAAHVEFGTYTTRRILNLDARGSATKRRADMRELFLPDSDPWRRHISTEGARIIGAALENLAAP